jgi:hypothetical protein
MYGRQFSPYRPGHTDKNRNAIDQNSSQPPQQARALREFAQQALARKENQKSKNNPEETMISSERRHPNQGKSIKALASAMRPALPISLIIRVRRTPGNRISSTYLAINQCELEVKYHMHPRFPFRKQGYPQ